MRSLTRRTLLCLLVWMMVFPGLVLAKPMRGKILTVSIKTKVIEFEHEDTFTKKKETIYVYFNPRTKLKGIPSFASLKPGDQLMIDAKKDYKENWQASAIEKPGGSLLQSKAQQLFGAKK